jgi:ParB family chromosome partitioning protein
MAAGRRTSLASLAGGKVEDVPGRSDPTLLRVPVTQLVPTRFNPRTNFGTEEELAEFGESLKRRQLQPAVVVSRARYLKLWPDEADAVGSATYVIANGERRYRGAREAGLTHLIVVLTEEVANSRADFLDAVLSENIDRKNFDPMEEAHAVDMMVRECGTAAAAATRYGRTEAWVSQRRALLRLAPEVQGMVRTGDIPVREARQLAGLPADQQAAVWQDRVQQRTEEKAKPKAKRALRSAPDPAPESAGPEPEPVSRTEPLESERQSVVFTAVKSPPWTGNGQGGGTPSVVPQAKAPDDVRLPSPADAPEPVVSQPKPMPWHDPEQVLAIARQKMAPDDFDRLLGLAAGLANVR